MEQKRRDYFKLTTGLLTSLHEKVYKTKSKYIKYPFLELQFDEKVFPKIPVNSNPLRRSTQPRDL